MEPLYFPDAQGSDAGGTDESRHTLVNAGKGCRGSWILHRRETQIQALGMHDQSSALLLTWPAWAGYLGPCALAAFLQNSSGVIGWGPVLFQGHGENKGLNVSGMVIKWIREWYKYFIQGEKWPRGEISYIAWSDEAAEIRCKNQRWGTKIWSLSVSIIIYCGQMKKPPKEDARISHL